MYSRWFIQRQMRQNIGKIVGGIVSGRFLTFYHHEISFAINYIQESCLNAVSEWDTIRMKVRWLPYHYAK
jgi:hypothetical protein